MVTTFWVRHHGKGKCSKGFLMAKACRESRVYLEPRHRQIGGGWWEKADGYMNVMGKSKKNGPKMTFFSPQQWEMHRHGHSPLNDAPTPSLDVKLIDLCVQITISVVLLRGKEELCLFPTCPDLRGRLFWWCCMSLVQRNSFFFLNQVIGFLKKCIKMKGNWIKKWKKSPLLAFCSTVENKPDTREVM